ncbi:MAG: TolB family protein [Planctomycetota bacterium]|jgi:hypothetical protein
MRFSLLVVAVVVLSVVAWAKKGGNGGGGGGGGADPALTGVIYFWTTTPDAAAVNADNGSTANPTLGGHLTYGLYGGQRWRLVGTTGADDLPGTSGIREQGLQAINEDGDREVLVSATERRVGQNSTYIVRWGKDDSFVSYTFLEMVDGEAVAYLARIAVDWVSGVPSTAGNTEEILFTLPVPSNWESDMEIFDWSPDGDEVVFKRRNEQIQVYNVNTDTTRTLASGRHPDWSPSGSVDRIVYERSGDIYTIAPDGTGETRVARARGPTNYFSPMWAPGSDYIAFAKNQSDILAVAANGGGVTTVASDNVWFLFCWR